nr:MAG TPA: TRAP PERIPLASMIC SOLUTE BINDING PROTEIN PERIPLASMIC SOLUTE BINDING FAMILY.3A [Caudoviricetes sp.]
MRRLLSTMVLILAFVLGACCSVPASAEQDNPIKIWPENENGPYLVLRIVDEDTGVNYIVAAVEYAGRLRGIGITPRFNSDGTLYTTK